MINQKRDRVQRAGLSIASWGLLTLALLPGHSPSHSNAAVAAPTADSELPADTAIPGDVADSNAEAVRIVLRLSDRSVSLYQGEKSIASYPVAVGAATTPTPQGQFEVSKLIIEPVWQSPWTGEMHAPGPNSALGLRWIGFYTSESGSFGFHGTPTLDSIGKAVSNGCVRMYNEDVVALFSQVRIGTPVIVEP